MKLFTRLAFLSLCLPTIAAAGPTVSSTGKASMTFAPTMTRVRVRLFAHGLSAASAMKKLEANQTFLTSEIEQLDEPKPQLSFGPIYEMPKAEGHMQMRMMAMMGNVETPEVDPRLKRMVCTVTLEWPLPDGAGGAQYDRLDEIRLQLQRLGLSEKNVDEDGNKSKDDAEEAAEQGADGKTKANDELHLAAAPKYYFARMLTDEELQQVTTKAFQDGKQQATRLANATGMQLGDLVSIASGMEAANMFSQIAEYQVTVQAMFGEGDVTFDEDAQRPAVEISQAQLRPLTYEYAVQLSFELK